MEEATMCMDDTKLEAPLPRIGLYMTAACTICMVLMGIDTIRGLVHKKPWYPCKFFSFNAMTLALLSVACKLPVDLSTRMPGREDQLTKLSGTVFICVSMCFFMPSLGGLENEEIISNMLAVSTFVITVVVDMSIQLSTGLIYKFRAENVVVLVCMLLLLGFMCSSAVAKVAAVKILEEQYKVRHEAQNEMTSQKVDMEYLKNNLPETWRMAYTNNPQYVLARSSLSMGAGALTGVCVVLLLQAEIRSFFTDFCTGQSSYQWGIWPLLISQTLAVLVGSVAPALRWLNAARMVLKDAGPRHWLVDCGVERLWVKELEDWKENPLSPYFKKSCSKKIAYELRNMMLDICILLQNAFVLLNNVVFLAFPRLVMLYLGTICSNVPGICPPDSSGREFSNGKNDHIVCRNVPGICPPDSSGREFSNRKNDHIVCSNVPGICAPPDSSGREFSNGKNDHTVCSNVPGICPPDSRGREFSNGKNDHIVLHLSAEAGKDMDQLMEKGRKMRCKELLTLLRRKSIESEGFGNMCSFSNSNVPPIPNSPSHVPPNCWTLPAVTLIAIAVSLSRFEEDRIKMMVNGLSEDRIKMMKDGLSEGLEMMKFVEKRWSKMRLRDARKAGEIVWSTIDINNKWLDCDLLKLPKKNKNKDDPKLTPYMQIIKDLADIGQEKVKKVFNQSNYHWSPDALAGNSLYRISRTILDFNTYETVDDLLDWIERILADIVGKCLSRLPNAIFIEYVIACESASETHMRNAVGFLWKADHLFGSPNWSQRQHLNRQEKTTDDPKLTCQKFPGFPCEHGHN